MPRRNKHPLLTGYTCREPYFKMRKTVIKISAFKLGKRNNPQPKSVRPAKQTEKSAVKIRINQDQV
jgi:hypothetical protein